MLYTTTEGVGLVMTVGVGVGVTTIEDGSTTTVVSMTLIFVVVSLALVTTLDDEVTDGLSSSVGDQELVVRFTRYNPKHKYTFYLSFQRDILIQSCRITKCCTTVLMHVHVQVRDHALVDVFICESSKNTR